MPKRSMQRKAAGGAMVQGFDLKSTGGGQPLPAAVAQGMGAAMGADFSDVRVHTDGQAEAVGALAFTGGSDIHVAQGKYDTTSQAGLELLGHELTHVVQQRGGAVETPDVDTNAAIVEHPGLEAAADAQGAQAAAAFLSGATGDAPAASAPPAATQAARAAQPKMAVQCAPPSAAGGGGGGGGAGQSSIPVAEGGFIPPGVGPPSMPGHIDAPGAMANDPAPGGAAPEAPKPKPGILSQIGTGASDVEKVCKAVGAVIDTAVKGIQFWDTYLMADSKGETKGLPDCTPDEGRKQELNAMFRYQAVNALMGIGDAVLANLTTPAPTSAPDPDPAAAPAPTPAPAPAAPAPAASPGAPAAAPPSQEAIQKEMDQAIYAEVRKQLLSLQMEDLIQQAASTVKAQITDKSPHLQWWWSEDGSMGTNSIPSNWGSWGEVIANLYVKDTEGMAGIPSLAASKFHMIASERKTHVEWLAGGSLTVQGHSALGDTCDVTIDSIGSYKAESAPARPGFFPLTVKFDWDQGDAVSHLICELTTAGNGDEIWLRNQQNTGEVDSW